MAIKINKPQNSYRSVSCLQILNLNTSHAFPCTSSGLNREEEQQCGTTTFLAFSFHQQLPWPLSPIKMTRHHTATSLQRTLNISLKPTLLPPKRTTLLSHYKTHSLIFVAQRRIFVPKKGKMHP